MTSLDIKASSILQGPSDASIASSHLRQGLRSVHTAVQRVSLPVPSISNAAVTTHSQTQELILGVQELKHHAHESKSGLALLPKVHHKLEQLPANIASSVSRHLEARAKEQQEIELGEVRPSTVVEKLERLICLENIILAFDCFLITFRIEE